MNRVPRYCAQALVRTDLGGRAHSSMDNPPSAHCQTKRPTSRASTPLNPGCLGGRINPLQSPFLFLPSHACLASKLASDVKTHQARSVLSYTHKNIPLNLGRVHTAFSLFQITLLHTGLNVFFRFGPSHPTTLSPVETLSFRPICLPQNLPSRRPLPHQFNKMDNQISCGLCTIAL